MPLRIAVMPAANAYQNYRYEDCRDNATLSMAYAMSMCIADAYQEDGRKACGFISV